MPDTDWLDDHVELFAVDALAADEHERTQTELDDLAPVERGIYDRRIAETRSAIADFASAYAHEAPVELRDRVLDRVAGEPPALDGDAPADDATTGDATAGDTTAGVARADDATAPAAAPESAPVVPIDRARSRRRRAALIAAAAVAVAVALGAGVLIGRTTAPEQPATSTIAQTQQQIADVLAAPDAQLSAGRLDDDRGVITVVSSRGRNQAVAVLRDPRNPVPADRTLQLWLVGKAAQPVSAGLVPPGGAGAPTLVDELDGASVLAVTMEPRGGSAQPTTPILVQVPI
ncbi:anti-sigma factor [Gordonia sp. NPDC003424]